MSLSLADLPDAILADIINRVGDRIYVISNREKNNLVMNPGLGQPWHSSNKRIAEHMAKQVGNGAFVCTLKEALNHHLFQKK